MVKEIGRQVLYLHAFAFVWYVKWQYLD
jgi:hypothetical protein